jgi:hypothetical protein
VPNDFEPESVKPPQNADPLEEASAMETPSVKPPQAEGMQSELTDAEASVKPPQSS